MKTCRTISPNKRENPLAFEFSPQIELNGQTLPFSQGHGLSYHPLFQNAAACEPALDEYGESDFDTPPSARSSTTTG